VSQIVNRLREEVVLLQFQGQACITQQGQDLHDKRQMSRPGTGEYNDTVQIDYAGLLFDPREDDVNRTLKGRRGVPESER
jgi:hypothetical protein